MSPSRVHASTTSSPAAVHIPAPQLAPPIVHQVLQVPGEALEPNTRGFFESRFGHDFSQVRIHADSRAAESADAVAARAYSVGNHVAFGAALYRPDSTAGLRLLAHELTHVVQQSNMSADGLLEIGAGNDPAEQAAEQAALTFDRPAHLAGAPARAMLRRQPTQTAPSATMPATPAPTSATDADKLEFARMALSFLQGQKRHFELATNVDETIVERTLTGMKSMVEGSIAGIAGQSAQPTLPDEIRAAYTDAVRALFTAHIRSHTSRILDAPTFRGLFEQFREVLLTHVLPQATVDPAADELSQELEPTGAATTPAERTRRAQLATARQKLTVLTSAITGLDIDALFSTQGGTMTIPLPTNTIARFSSSIPQTLHYGLQNLAATLAGSSLGANTTVMVALPLEAYGGGYDAYRFTRLDLGAAGEEILIERQGAIGIEGLRQETRQPLQDRFDQLGFQRTGFSQDEFDQVLIAIGEVPDSVLTTLNGLSFARAAVSATNPDAGGEYDQSTHTITMFDSAFADSSTRFGRAGRTLKFAASAVVHEIGHAADLRSLRLVATDTETAQQALMAEFGTGGGGFSIPHVRDPARARFDQLQGDITTAERAEARARSASGSRWSGGAVSTVTETTPRGEATPAFRAAARLDGGRADVFPTNYPNPAMFWQEYFAESFALYQTAPDTLRRIRPNVYQYFVTTFPRTP